MARATGYNVQVFRGRRRVLNAWSRDTRLRVPVGVLKQGRTYVWVVWPANGPRRVARFALPVGRSTFAVTLRPRHRLPQPRRAAPPSREVRPHIPFGDAAPAPARRARAAACPRSWPSTAAAASPFRSRSGPRSGSAAVLADRGPEPPVGLRGPGRAEPPRSRAPPEDASGALIHQGPASAASGARTPLRRIDERTTNRAITSTSATAARGAPRGDRGRRRRRPGAALQRRLMPPRGALDLAGPDGRQHGRLRLPLPGRARHRDPGRELRAVRGAGRRSELLPVLGRREVRDQGRQHRRRPPGRDLRVQVRHHDQEPGHVPLQQQHGHVRRQDAARTPTSTWSRPTPSARSRATGRARPTSRRSAGIS